MALASTVPYSQLQSNYAVACMRDFGRYITNSSDFETQTYIKDSVLLDFADKVAVQHGCRVYSNSVSGISVGAVPCNRGNYDPGNAKLLTRSNPMVPYDASDLKLECKLACMGLDSRGAMMSFLEQLFMKLRRAAISTVDEALLGSLSGTVTLDGCGADQVITADQDGIASVNATGTGGLTDTIVGQVLTALSENDALGNASEDVLLVLPAKALEQWRASLPAGSLDFADYQGSRLVNRIRGMYVYTPLHQKKVFVKGSATIGGSTVNGIVAYALVRNAIRFGYKVPNPMFNDPGTNTVNINFAYGVTSLGANAFDTKRGIHFTYDLHCGALRQAPWGIVRILLPTNIFG